MTRPDHDMITDACASFASNGYLVLPGLCGETLLEGMRRKVLEDLEAAVGPVEYEAEVGYPGAPATRTAPGGQTIRRLRDAIARDAVFHQWAMSETLTDWARLLLAGRDIRLVRAHHNCIMTKHPDFSSATGWHQDTRYWSYRRADLVNAWTALGHEAVDNGGMRVIPGSHRKVFAPDCFDDEQFFREDPAANRALIEQAVQVDLAPGDVLWFHAALLHAAGPNLTRERKFAVVFSYRAADNPPLPGSRSDLFSDIDPLQPTPRG